MPSSVSPMLASLAGSPFSDPDWLPTDFTILNVPDRLTEQGDLWASIMSAKGDLSQLLKLSS